MLSAAYYLESLLLAAVAVCYSYVLVQPGMLLAPVQAWVRARWRGRHYIVENFKAIDSLEIKLLERGGGVIDFTQQSEIWKLRDAVKQAQELDHRWWWKITWGCPSCISGQWGLWGFLLLGWDSWQVALAHPSFIHILAALFCHLGFAALTIFFAAGWRAFYALCQSIN